MSRFIVPSSDQSMKVVVGWDEDAAGFYVRCFRTDERDELITGIDQLRCLDDLDAALRVVNPGLVLPSMLDLYLFMEQVGDDHELRRLDRLVAVYRARTPLP